LDVFGDIGGADEHHLYGSVAARNDERTFSGLLGTESGILEQRKDGLAQPPFRRNREGQLLTELLFNLSKISL
jgi:hypothetical protein